MKRLIASILRNFKIFTTSELTYRNANNGSFTVHVPGGESFQVRIWKSKDRWSTDTHIQFDCYSVSFSVIQSRPPEQIARQFEELLKTKAVPHHRKHLEACDRAKRVDQFIQQIVSDDPRISVSTEGKAFTIQLRLDDLTEVAKIADFYREYFNGTTLPVPYYWTEVDGNPVPEKDWERYYKERAEQNAKELAEEMSEEQSA